MKTSLSSIVIETLTTGIIVTKTIALILMILVLTACTSVKYQEDYKSGTDFNGLTTYSWRNVSMDIPNTPISATTPSHVQKLIDAYLQQQNYVLKADKPDLTLDLQGFSRVSTGGTTGIGFSIGLPVGNSGSLGVGTGHTLGKGKKEGVLVIDITHTATNSLLWRGTAEAIPLSYFSLASEKKLSEVIAKLLAQFPPKSQLPPK